jgi:hypothetical protein
LMAAGFTAVMGGTDWSDAVETYNTRRAQIKGEIVARVSAYFGFDLPVTFPIIRAAMPTSRSRIRCRRQSRRRHGSYKIES